jgi:hypothetical protein
MNTKTLHAAVLSVILLFVFQLQGCTVGGYTIGKMIDSSKPDTTFVAGSQLESLKAGKEVKIMLIDGSQVTGKYLGFDQVSREQYAELYESFRQQNLDAASLPALETNMEITLKSGIKGERQLWDFDRNPDLGTFISVKMVGDTTSGIVQISEVDRVIDANGNTTEGEILRKLASENQIPLIQAITVKDNSGTQQIPVHSVHQIAVKNKKIARWVGLGLGAGIDVAAIAIAIGVSIAKEKAFF